MAGSGRASDRDPDRDLGGVKPGTSRQTVEVEPIPPTVTATVEYDLGRYQIGERVGPVERIRLKEEEGPAGAWIEADLEVCVANTFDAS